MIRESIRSDLLRFWSDVGVKKEHSRYSVNLQRFKQIPKVISKSGWQERDCLELVLVMCRSQQHPAIVERESREARFLCQEPGSSAAGNLPTIANQSPQRLASNLHAHEAEEAGIRNRILLRTQSDETPMNRQNPYTPYTLKPTTCFVRKRHNAQCQCCSEYSSPLSK